MENANKPLKTLYLEPIMYQKTEEQLRFENFHLPFSGHLDLLRDWFPVSPLLSHTACEIFPLQTW